MVCLAKGEPHDGNERTFFRHTAKPGRRDEVKRIWEHYVQLYVATSPQQPANFYYYDDRDPDTILVFQLHGDSVSGNAFVQQPWYGDYPRETAELLACASEFRTATPQWIKTLGS